MKKNTVQQNKYCNTPILMKENTYQVDMHCMYQALQCNIQRNKRHNMTQSHHLKQNQRDRDSNNPLK